MRLVAVVLLGVVAADARGGVASLPLCREIAVTVTAFPSPLPVGQQPRFDVSIDNAARVPRRVLDLRAGRRPDLQDNYVELIVSQDGAEIPLPMAISDPGPISPADFVELPVAGGILIADLSTRRSLSGLKPGRFEAIVVYWMDPYDIKSRCRSAPVGFTVTAAPPPPARLRPATVHDDLRRRHM